MPDSSNTSNTRPKIPRSELIDELQRLHDEHDRTPTINMMNEKGNYNATTYQNHFGSWNNAVEAAGLEPNHPRYTKQELLNDLQALADELGHTPTFSEMTEHGACSGVLYANRFGSWNAALEAAGLEPNAPHQRQLTDEELLDDLRALADELDTTSPSSKKMNTIGAHNSKTYKDRFGSWNNAVEAAGLEPNEPLQNRHSKPELLADLVELAKDLGRVPTQKEIREYTDYSHNTYYNHWGSIKHALEASDEDLGDVDMARNTKPYSITRDDLLDELRRLADELDRPPRWTDIREHSKYSDSPYRSRFDSLDDAYREAGINLN